MVTHFSAAHLTLNGTRVLCTKDRKGGELEEVGGTEGYIQKNNLKAV